MAATTLPLIRGRISLEDALAEDKDMVQELSYPEKRFDFWALLYQNRPQIEQTIAHHLNISTSDFRLGEVKEWVHGSFNACLPFHITTSKRTSLRLPEKGIIRFALPYKIGEEHHAGNVDEKIRSEAATYIWLQKNCPEVPIPRLLGFGLPSGQSFLSLDKASFFSRLWWHVRNVFARLSSGSALAPFAICRRQHLPGLGYLVIEFVQEGRKLSDTWFQQNTDASRRANLFRGLSRVMLSLTDRPLPRIASWTLSDAGMLSLSSRPLTMALHRRENHGMPTDIPRHRTYTSAPVYCLDLLASQDHEIRGQPNSVHSTGDGEMQLATLVAMRMLVSQYASSIGRQERDGGEGGPFYLTLTDLHPSNIFVDDDWNVTKIIDLEWSCARPLEMTFAPYWISGYAIDDIPRHRNEYASVNEEFLTIFEQEAQTAGAASAAAAALTRPSHKKTSSSDDLPQKRATMLREQYEAQSPWYFRALDETPGIVYLLYRDFIRPRFFAVPPGDVFNHVVAPLWAPGTSAFIAGKLDEQEAYFDRLREIYRKAEAKEEGDEAEEKASEKEQNEKS